MLNCFLFLCLFIEFAFATLSPSKDPYSGDPDQNYIYEQACHQYASEHSIRYESSIVQTKMFYTFYTECLTSIWPKCEVMDAKDLLVACTPYVTFKVDDAIACDVDGKPSMMAQSPGFIAGRLTELGNLWYIFWDPSKPNTDVERFNKIKFASTSDLYNIHLKNLTTGIKKFRNAGIEESPEKLHIIEKLSDGKQRRIIDFQGLKDAFELCMIKIEMSGQSHKLANGNVEDLKLFLSKNLSSSSIEVHALSEGRLGERSQLFHPLYTVIKPGFPFVVHYMPSGMKPIFRPHHQRYRSFVVAAFDEKGNFVKDHRKKFVSLLMVAFDSIKLE